MSGDDAAALIGVLGAMALVGSALARRQLETSKALRMALTWAGIFGLAWLAAAILTRF